MQERKEFAFFLGGLREKQGITMERLCQGLCSGRNAMYIMRGEREPDRLMREALLERLGLGAEDYEAYLGCEEYVQWKLQQQILHCILYRELERGEALLEAYRTAWCPEKGCGAEGGPAGEEKGAAGQPDVRKKRSGGSCCVGRTGRKLERQFYLSMLVQIRRYQGGSREVLSAMFEEALGLTVPSWETAVLSELVLSVKELNLILEAERCRGAETGRRRDAGPVRKEDISRGTGSSRRERPERYREVLQYIEARKLDRRGLAKLYPKTVYFLCRCLTERRGAESTDQMERKDVRELLGYCNRAVKLLRDNGRMYYLWELLDMRERFFSELEENTDDGSSETPGNREVFRQQRQKNQEWKQVLEKVYQEFNVPKETLDYCYLYVSKGVSCINEVIRIRSRMFGIKDAELCEGVCTVKTLQRIRRSVTSPRRFVAKGLFEKLGLSGELVRTEIVTGVPEAREMMERQREYSNNHQWKEAEMLLKQVENLITMDTPCNKQAIQRLWALFRLRRGEIDKGEYYRQVKAALELTLPYKYFLSEGEKYLTYEEQSCIENMMKVMDKKSEEFWICVQRFEDMYQTAIAEGELENINGMYEFIMRNVRSEWGNTGKYDKADAYDLIIIEGCLRTRRLWSVHDGLYDRYWNYIERKKHGIPVDDILDDKEELNKCILLGELAQSRDVIFYQKKLKQIQESSGSV